MAFDARPPVARTALKLQKLQPRELLGLEEMEMAERERKGMARSQRRLSKNGTVASSSFLSPERKDEKNWGKGGGIIIGRGREWKWRQEAELQEWWGRAVHHGEDGATAEHGGCVEQSFCLRKKKQLPSWARSIRGCKRMDAV